MINLRRLLLSGFGVAMLATTPSLFAQQRFDYRDNERDNGRDYRRIERDERALRHEREEMRRNLYRHRYGRFYYDRFEARHDWQDLNYARRDFYRDGNRY